MGNEWWVVRQPSGSWFLAHFTELALWPTAEKRPALSSSVTLNSVREVVERLKRRTPDTPTWLEN